MIVDFTRKRRESMFWTSRATAASAVLKLPYNWTPLLTIWFHSIVKIGLISPALEY